MTSELYMLKIRFHKHQVSFLVVKTVKGELEKFQIYFRKMPLHQQIFFGGFYLIRLGCREI